MKKLLLLSVLIFTAVTLSAQYDGVPWNGAGNPWTFQDDNYLNIHVGKDLNWKNAAYLGVPHYAYDIGKVDTLKLPSEDLDGKLVAGSGDMEAGQSPSDDYRSYIDRYTVAADLGITLSPSDTMSQFSTNYGGSFTSHENSAVANGTSGWYRYTCNFADAGNYKLVIRGWGANKSGHGFWVRMYNKATMAPIYPWTRIHPGQGGNVFEDQENAVFIDLNDTLYANNLYSKAPSGASWIESSDEFSLDGDVVFEYTNIGPSADYDKDVTGSGRSFWGEFTFLYQGATADKFAPVAGPYKTFYDDMMNFSVSLNEAGTLYLVTKGTAIADAETNNIDKKVMTTDDTFELDLTTIVHPDTVQIVTADAAGNMRITAPITIVKAFSADTTQGETGDTILVNTRRSGFVALVPASVAANRTAIDLAIATGSADTINVDGGNDTLVIVNLIGDQNLKLYLVDLENDEVSYAIDFQLGEGGVPESVFNKELNNIKVYLYYDEIVVEHQADYSNIVLYDILGKKHISKSVDSNRISLNTNNLNNGIYIITMTGKSGIVTKKFLLSR